MLISHKHRFIFFIHIYKNAGTSIMTALSPYAFYNPFHQWVYKISSRIGLRHKIPLDFNPQPVPPHSSAKQIAAEIGFEKFKSYFSFAIVRNPWDWQTSLYEYMRRDQKHHQHEKAIQFRDFTEYIHWRCQEEVRFQKDFICDENGTLLVNFVGRYENLTQDFQKICEQIGVQASLPRLNVSKTRPYQEYYTPETIGAPYVCT